MTTTESPQTKQVSLASLVGSALNRLQQDFLSGSNHAAQASARGVLAELRRAAGMSPEQDLVAWQQALELVLPDLPEQFQGRGDAPSRSERAIYDAVTLFAFHMQSQKLPMHSRDRSFARAVGNLVAKRDSESIKPRFDALLLARNPNTRRQHLRGLVALLRTEKIAFDYGRFAEDLLRLEGPARNSVLLAWGRDFANGRFRKNESDNNQ